MENQPSTRAALLATRAVPGWMTGKTISGFFFPNMISNQSLGT